MRPPLRARSKLPRGLSRYTKYRQIWADRIRECPVLYPETQDTDIIPIRIVNTGMLKGVYRINVSYEDTHSININFTTNITSCDLDCVPSTSENVAEGTQ